MIVIIITISTAVSSPPFTEPLPCTRAFAFVTSFHPPKTTECPYGHACFAGEKLKGEESDLPKLAQVVQSGGGI